MNYKTAFHEPQKQCVIISHYDLVKNNSYNVAKSKLYKNAMNHVHE